jgi:ribosomal protein S18 acetylase RimI-like enzyme
MVAASEPVTEFLRNDELRHITPLKMFTLFGEALHVVPVRSTTKQGYVFIMPRAASQWDSEKYPSAMYSIYVALPVDADAELIAASASTVLRESAGQPFVIKTIEPKLIDALQNTNDARLPLRYQLALLTLTPTERHATLARRDIIENDSTSNGARSVCYDHIPHDAQTLLDAHDVYSASEMQTMFADASARCWLRYVGDAPVAIALTFANSTTLHEIGSLYVRADARRAGHAEALVRAALHDLENRALKIRYVVDAENAASIALATRCGLQEALRSEHWLSK